LLRSLVEQKELKNGLYVGVGSLLFLRFICPVRTKNKKKERKKQKERKKE